MKFSLKNFIQKVLTEMFAYDTITKYVQPHGEVVNSEKDTVFGEFSDEEVYKKCTQLLKQVESNIK